jgi:hypothetical protein
MKPTLTSKITQCCVDSRENSFSVVFSVQLNLSNSGSRNWALPARFPFSTIEQLIWRTEVPNPFRDLVDLTVLTREEALEVQGSFISREYSKIIETAINRTMIPIILLGMDFQLILSLVYSDGLMQLILQCPSGGTEGIKEWSSDVLQNIRTVGRGRQKAIRA